MTWLGHLAMLAVSFALGVLMGRMVGGDVGELRKRLELVENESSSAYITATRARIHGMQFGCDESGQAWCKPIGQPQHPFCDAMPKGYDGVCRTTDAAQELAPESWVLSGHKSPIDLEPVPPGGEYREATH